MKTMKNVFFALKEIDKSSRAIFPLMFLCALIQAAVSVLDLFLLKWIIDYALSEHFVISTLLLYLLLYFLVITLFKAFNSRFSNIFIHKFEIRIMERTKRELYQKIETIDLSDYSDSEFYDKLDRALDNIGIQYFKMLLHLFSLLINIFTSAAVFTYYGDAVILLATVMNVANYMIYYFVAEKFRYDFNKKEEPYFRQHEYPERIFYLPEYAQELRLLDGLGERLMEKDARETYKYIGRYRSFLHTFFGQATAMTAISNIIFTLASIYVSGLLFDKVISVGEFLVAISVVTTMSDHLIDLVKTIPDFYHSGLLISDIREMLDYESAFPENKAGVQAERFESLIADNISFKYDENSVFSIHDVSFSVTKNQVIAIAGLNGSGKSTMLDLILSLIKPQGGNLSLNGIPYEDYNVSSLRNMFSVVFQDFQMYEVSVAENILMREIESDEDIKRVEEALKFVGLYEKVMTLEKGIHTVMSSEENTGGFSGGERQKLAIARAYVKPAPILFFDEPTSALDVFASEAFYSDLFRMKEQQSRTILYTTHKLKHTVKADKILYIKDGTISESGTHQELMKLNGEYAQLYQLG